MIDFELNFFKKFKYTNKQVEKHLESAKKDIKIADEAKIADVKFLFTYNSLIKLSIAIIACYGYKASSRAGHHLKIIEMTAEILENDDVMIIGNLMRKSRNTELYNGGIFITDKQAYEYCRFVKKLFKLSENIFKKCLHKLF